jgi:hypothetical protein
MTASVTRYGGWLALGVQIPLCGLSERRTSMPYMSVTADQMSSAAGYLVKNWGDYGYRFEGIETRTHAVSVFRAVASDGGRFAIVADKWGNCQHHDTHTSDDGLAALVTWMHANTTAK